MTLCKPDPEEIILPEAKQMEEEKKHESYAFRTTNHMYGPEKCLSGNKLSAVMEMTLNSKRPTARIGFHQYFILLNNGIEERNTSLILHLFY